MGKGNQALLGRALGRRDPQWATTPPRTPTKGYFQDWTTGYEYRALMDVRNNEPLQ